VGASVVAGGDAPLVHEAAEHVLDLVALAVERLIIGKATFQLLDEGCRA
jgi:hypothetical protein